MHNLGVEGQRVFWCPRCGTVKVDPAVVEINGQTTEFVPIYIPTLRDRIKDAECRAVDAGAANGTAFIAVPAHLWEHLIEAAGVPSHGALRR